MWTCKPQNVVPGRGDMSGVLLDRFLCLPGSRGRVAPEGNIVRGGYVSIIGYGLFPPSFFYLAAGQSLSSGGPASE